MAGGERSAGVHADERVPGFSRPGQIVGGPEWIHTQALDVNAKADDNPPVGVIDAMVKQLFADRFKLRVHTESRKEKMEVLVIDSVEMPTPN